MPYRFTIARPMNCFLPCRAPVSYRLLIQSSFRAVPSQKLRLVLGNLGEFALERFRDTGVERASGLAQQRAIGGVLHKRVLEQIGRVRRQALPEQQTSCDETVERSLQFRFRPADD